MSRLPFVNYYIDNKQTFSCDWAKPDFRTNFNFIISTVCFNNEDNRCQLHKFKK